MASFLVFAVLATLAIAAVCTAVDVSQDRVGVLGRRLKGTYNVGAGLNRAGFRGAPDGGVKGLSVAEGHQFREAGHGTRGVHVLGEKIRNADLRRRIAAGFKGQGFGQSSVWAGQGARYGLGKTGANVGLDADNHGLGQVIANVRHGKGARLPRNVLTQDDIQGGVGKIIAGALAGKGGVPQIVETSLGLGRAWGKLNGNTQDTGSAPVGAGGQGDLKSGAGLGPLGGWANNAGPQGRNLGSHGGPSVWNNGRSPIVGHGLVNLAPSELDGSWDKNNGRMKVNPEGIIYIEDDGGPVIRGNLEWKDIGDGNFQWVKIGQNQVVKQTQSADGTQGAGENQETNQNKGADKNQGARQNETSDQNQRAEENEGVGQDQNRGQKQGVHFQK